jgi:hypothetical protein
VKYLVIAALLALSGCGESGEQRDERLMLEVQACHDAGLRAHWIEDDDAVLCIPYRKKNPVKLWAHKMIVNEPAGNQPKEQP